MVLVVVQVRDGIGKMRSVILIVADHFFVNPVR